MAQINQFCYNLSNVDLLEYSAVMPAQVLKCFFYFNKLVLYFELLIMKFHHIYDHFTLGTKHSMQISPPCLNLVFRLLEC